MAAELVLNPYTSFAVHGDAGADYILIAPKPGSGLQILNLRPSEQPRLHALFGELVESQLLATLDIENDLDNAERDLLTQYGVLIAAAGVPEKPLFSCLLDDVEAGEFDGSLSSLTIAPSFRFEPFDLANFRALANEKHFSPYMASAWITSPGWGFETGYWLNGEQAALVSQFRAGGDVPEINRGLVAKLVAAGILIDPAMHSREEGRVHSEINGASENFSDLKYAVLRDVIPLNQVRAMQSFYRRYVGQGFMQLGDPVVGRRYREPNEPLARFFHTGMTGLMSALAGREVKPSYCYSSTYIEGAELRPHVDRPMCEYSFSIQIDYQPLPDDGVSPWALNLSTCGLDDNHRYSLTWDDFPAGADTEKAITLANGDVLAYKGCELAHYRRPLPIGHTSTSLFFHYVLLDFDGELI